MINLKLKKINNLPLQQAKIEISSTKLKKKDFFGTDVILYFLIEVFYIFPTKNHE